MKSESKICQNCKKEFIIDSEDFNFYQKIKVPPPTFCPMCRVERRLNFRNERRLFKVKNSNTGKSMFSLYPDKGTKKNLTQEEWFSDQFDAIEYGIDFDFSKDFFVQFMKLEEKVPVFPLRVEFMINSPFCANASYLKNCYLCFNSNSSEDCMYGNATDFCKDCIDNSHINNSERSYESFWLSNCYQCYFSKICIESQNLWFCRDCLGCSNCFGCVNLRKESYCIYNKKYKREEYFKEIEKMNLSTIQGILEAKEKTRDFWKRFPNKSHQGLRNLNSTGSYVTNCKNVNDSYLIRESENIKYSQYLQVPKSKDCYDTTAWGANTELNYETAICGHNSYNNKFCSDCWPNSKNLEYSISLFSCSDCFGCVGLKKKQYCILNKQYTKEEYEILLPKIKKHMNDTPYIDSKGRIYKYGEFFPIEFSPFGYNNSTAIQFFKMTKEDAEKKNYPWVDIPKGEYLITKKNEDLPSDIKNVDKNILKEIIECKNCKRAYQILENELIFYKKENLPLPITCNDCRFEDRIEQRLKIDLYNRQCMCAGNTDKTGTYKNTASHSHSNNPCNEEFKTGYSPESNDIVYCESCYNKEVY